MDHREVVDELLRSPEPSIRWRTRVRVLGERRSSARVRALEREVRSSPRVKALLSHAFAPYRDGTSRNVYYNWQGLQWVFASLADLGYPRGDRALEPLRDRIEHLWTGPSYHRSYTATTRGQGYGRAAVPVIQGRARRCASQQGNALFAISTLGLLDEGSRLLAQLLQGWQWPDGGWNCDRDPSADTSSFCETLTPMRGLAAYAEETGDRAAARAARRAAEVFLVRELFRRRSTGKVIRPDFLALHYPLYWHYDVLGGLKGMASVGRLRDPRCRKALDWLEEAERPHGGWAASARFYRVSDRFQAGCEFVDWGPETRGGLNEWVTTDALAVLIGAGRIAL
jgi:hypothetical protein